MLAEIAMQRLPADVFYDLAEDGEPVITVGPDCRTRRQPQVAGSTPRGSAAARPEERSPHPAAIDHA